MAFPSPPPPQPEIANAGLCEPVWAPALKLSHGFSTIVFLSALTVTMALPAWALPVGIGRLVPIGLVAVGIVWLGRWNRVGSLMGSRVHRIELWSARSCAHAVSSWIGVAAP